MTGQISMQSVLLFATGGISSVCVAFVLYWKLLAEKHLQKQKVAVPVQPRANDRRQKHAPIVELCIKGAH